MSGRSIVGSSTGQLFPTAPVPVGQQYEEKLAAKARNVQTLGYRLTSLAAKVEDQWLANDFFVMLKPCLRCSSSTTPITKSNSQTSRRPCKISTAKSANSGRILKNCEPVCKAAWEQYLAYLGGLRRILVRFHGLFAGHHVNM